MVCAPPPRHPRLSYDENHAKGSLDVDDLPMTCFRWCDVPSFRFLAEPTCVGGSAVRAPSPSEDPAGSDARPPLPWTDPSRPSLLLPAGSAVPREAPKLVLIRFKVPREPSRLALIRHTLQFNAAARASEAGADPNPPRSAGRRASHKYSFCAERKRRWHAPVPHRQLSLPAQASTPDREFCF